MTAPGLAATACIIALFFCSGCVAAFRSDDLDVGHWPPPGRCEPPTIALQFDIGSVFPYCREGPVVGGVSTCEVVHTNARREEAADAVSEVILGVYRDSGLLAEIMPSANDSDVLAHVDVNPTVDRHISGAVIDIFFGLVPVHLRSTRYDVKTVLTAAPDREIAIEKSAGFETWYHLFLTFLVPFLDEAAVSDRALRDVTRATISSVNWSDLTDSDSCH